MNENLEEREIISRGRFKEIVANLENLGGYDLQCLLMDTRTQKQKRDNAKDSEDLDKLMNPDRGESFVDTYDRLNDTLRRLEYWDLRELESILTKKVAERDAEEKKQFQRREKIRSLTNEELLKLIDYAYEELDDRTKPTVEKEQ